MDDDDRKKHRLLKVLLCESSPNWGGQEFRIAREAAWLQRRGHQVMVVCGAGSRLAARLPREVPDVAVRTLPSWKSPRGLVLFLRHVREWSPDVIHSHSGHDALLAMISHLAGRTVIRSRHITLPSAMPLQRKLTYRFGCSRLVASAEFIKRDMVKVIGVPEHRVDVVGEGVNLSEFHPDIDGRRFRAEFGIPEKAPLFGLVAMIRGEKGHACFVKAAAQVAAAIPEARFVFVGDGDAVRVKKLRNRVAEHFRGNSHSVAFAGYREDIPQVMAALSALVVPSLHEAQTLVIPQAFATGRPVVASRVGGIPEILAHEKTGLLVTANDDAGFASAMIRLAESPDFRHRLGRAAREFACQELSFDRKMELLVGSYHRALNPSARP